MTNNKQQTDHIVEANKMITAVEWLQSIELERDLTLADWKQAKAMHKTEIEDAELRGKEIIIIKHTEHGGGEQ